MNQFYHGLPKVSYTVKFCYLRPLKSKTTLTIKTIFSVPKIQFSMFICHIYKICLLLRPLSTLPLVVLLSWLHCILFWNFYMFIGERKSKRYVKINSLECLIYVMVYMINWQFSHQRIIHCGVTLFKIFSTILS